METPTFEKVRCGTCREILSDTELMKEPLGSDRLSVFCGRCQRFLFVYDPKAANELNDIISTRNRIENRTSKTHKTPIKKETPSEETDEI